MKFVLFSQSVSCKTDLPPNRPRPETMNPLVDFQVYLQKYADLVDVLPMPILQIHFLPIGDVTHLTNYEKFRSKYSRHSNLLEHDLTLVGLHLPIEIMQLELELDDGEKARWPKRVLYQFDLKFSHASRRPVN